MEIAALTFHECTFLLEYTRKALWEITLKTYLRGRVHCCRNIYKTVSCLDPLFVLYLTPCVHRIIGYNSGL